MKKILIHLGTAKTGTTSIQKTLAKASKDDILGPVSYPLVLRKAENHGFLTSLYRPYDKLPRSIKSKYSAESELFTKKKTMYRNEIFNEVAGKDNIILSSEWLLHFSPAEISAFKRDLELSGVDEVAIVIYIRYPPSHYLSMLQQRLKASHTIINPLDYKYNFKSKILRWNSYSPGKIIIRPFERVELYDSCVVKDFLNIASDYFSINLMDINTYDENESLSVQEMLLLQKYRKLFHPNKDNIFKKDSDLLLKVLKYCRKYFRFTRPKLRQSIEAIILENHKDDLEWLKKYYNIKFYYGKNFFCANEVKELYNKNGNLSLSDVIQKS